jgi:hypothetical protein
MVLLRGSKFYVWQCGIQCHRVDSSPEESCLWWASWWILCPSWGGFEGSSIAALVWSPYVRRSRARLTKDRGMHSGGRGDVLSIWVSTVLGMARQCPRWQHSGGDDWTGPEVTEETCSTGLTSQHCPRLARGRWLYPFRGCHRPLSRGATRRRYRNGRHNVMEMTPAFSQSTSTALGMATQCGLVEQCRDMIPRWCQRAGGTGIRL